MILPVICLAPPDLVRAAKTPPDIRGAPRGDPRLGAHTLFSQRGYLLVSIDAIATEAGVSKALIYDPEASRGQLVEIAMDFAWLGLERLQPRRALVLA